MKEVFLSKKYCVMNILICYNLSMVTKRKSGQKGKHGTIKDQIKALLEKSYTNKKICEELNLAKSTVSKHVRELTIENIERLEASSTIKENLLTKSEQNAIKVGSLEVLDEHLNTKLPMLKNLKKKMQHYESLRPVEVTMKRMKINKLIDLGAEAIEEQLLEHKNQTKTLSPRDISSLVGSLNNIAALVERQSERVTPQSIQDMPEHMMYANSDRIINVKSNGEPLI